MNLIQCDADCIYQEDGYCRMETPAVITNHIGGGCVHQINVAAKRSRETTYQFNQLPPQTRL